MDDAEEPDRAPADQELILGALMAHEVDFLVLGGIAVYIHGYARLTSDVDILPNPSVSNMKRLAAALEGLDAEALDEHGRRIGLDLSRPEGLAVGTLLLETKHGALDLVNGERPDLLRYRRLAAAAISVTLAGREIRVVSKDDLIEMKRASGRPKDLRDIAALTELSATHPADRLAQP